MCLCVKFVLSPQIDDILCTDTFEVSVASSPKSALHRPCNLMLPQCTTVCNDNHTFEWTFAAPPSTATQRSCCPDQLCSLQRQGKTHISCGVHSQKTALPLGACAYAVGGVLTCWLLVTGKGNVKIWGTQPKSIDDAEDRDKWYEILTKPDIKQPPGGMCTDESSALNQSKKLGFPVMVRPSFVLGGRAMEIVYRYGRQTRPELHT